MGYCDDPRMVRVDFFKPSGKWYTTEAIKFDRYYAKDETHGYEYINDTFKRCLREQLKGRLNGMTAVCLEPYHENAYPLLVSENLGG